MFETTNQINSGIIMRHTIYQLVQDCFTGHRKSTRQVRDTPALRPAWPSKSFCYKCDGEYMWAIKNTPFSHVIILVGW